jgi:hypothetical protein
MKILFIANNNSNDFLSDAVYHGLKNISEVSVFDLHPLWYMYDNISKKDLLHRFHGRGFTYYADLSGLPNTITSIEEKLADRFFDLVVYGNIIRCSDYFETVKKYYNPNEILILDGEDEHNRPGLYEDLIGKGVYYRRELSAEEATKHSTVKPIFFAYPENKIPNTSPDKEKLLAHIIPGVKETFIFDDEKSYYQDYRQSLFGYTWRKAGWDCLRHYEILGNGCIPLFLDLQHCPTTICTSLPKELLREYYHKAGLFKLFEMDKPVYYNLERTLITNRDLTLLNNVDLSENFYYIYLEYLEKLLQYTKQNLTTKALAQYILR